MGCAEFHHLTGHYPGCTGLVAGGFGDCQGVGSFELSQNHLEALLSFAEGFRESCDHRDQWIDALMAALQKRGGPWRWALPAARRRARQPFGEKPRRVQQDCASGTRRRPEGIVGLAWRPSFWGRQGVRVRSALESEAFRVGA
jgi:hypothetical protein